MRGVLSAPRRMQIALQYAIIQESACELAELPLHAFFFSLFFLRRPLKHSEILPAALCQCVWHRTLTGSHASAEGRALNGLCQQTVRLL